MPAVPGTVAQYWQVDQKVTGTPHQTLFMTPCLAQHNEKVRRFLVDEFVTVCTAPGHGRHRLSFQSYRGLVKAG